MNLVTGGLGFIGNELIRQLRYDGVVAAVDTRNRVAPRIEDLADVPVYGVDVVDRRQLVDLFQELKPKVVFHLAAIHFIPECNANPERTLRVNLEGTQSVLSACEKAGVEHLVVASSGAVYADSAEPLREDSPVAPVDIYGWSKLFTEQLCQWHSAQSGLRISVLRIFNNYGPRETNAHIIPEIIGQLKNGDLIRLGNTKSRRDYIHTTDTAKAARLIAAKPPSGCRIVNVASGHHASVDELIVIMGQILGRQLVVETDPGRFRKADKLVQVANVELLERVIGWAPEIELRLGLEGLLEFEGLLKR